MDNATSLKKTPLYEEHVKLGGKMVPFAGFELPVQYKAGVIKEHMAVREGAGIFDVSHMGEVIIKGAKATENLNYIMTNSFDDMKVGTCRYTLMLYENATQIDDLIVYKKSEDEYLLVLNAANTQKDIEWLKKHIVGCELIDISSDTAQIALQGPNARAIMLGLCENDALPQKKYTFSQDVNVLGAECIISKTGYTGEAGYEIYLPFEKASTVWQQLIKKGAVPCGLGARDTLRFEASMPLYGHELSEQIHALEANLNFAIKRQKSAYIGKNSIDNPPENLRTRVGLKVTGRGIVREAEPLFCGEVQAGITTSGTHCPHLGGAYAMAYVAPQYSEIGTVLRANVRGRDIELQVVALPFYKG